MSLPAQIVALMLTEHVREPFVGPVLAYGKQSMNIRFDGMLEMFKALGIAPDPAGLADPPPADTYVDFARLLKLLGLGELCTLDVSPYEGADIVADLNFPVPPELVGRFGLIVDGGTMEHVFDIRQGMKNTADMLRAGGRALHTTPVNNYVNHGFVQISPTFYYDYYVENEFDDVRGIMIVQPRAEMLYLGWNFFHYDHATMSGESSMFCASNTQLGVYFTARKTPLSTSGRVPMQSYFVRTHAGAATPDHKIAITHDQTLPKFEYVAESAREAGAAIHEIVHVGFGSLRGPMRVELETGR